MTYRFSERLKELMDDRKVSQDKLAEALGRKRQTIGSWLSGRTDPDTDMLFRIAEFFHVSSDYLLGIADDRSINPDIQQAAKTTGLSGRAIETLVRLGNNNEQGKRTVSMLNTILEDRRVFMAERNILAMIYEYCNAYNGNVELMRAKGDDVPIVTVNGSMSFMPIKECYLMVVKEWIMEELGWLAKRGIKNGNDNIKDK